MHRPRVSAQLRAGRAVCPWAACGPQGGLRLPLENNRRSFSNELRLGTDRSIQIVSPVGIGPQVIACQIPALCCAVSGKGQRRSVRAAKAFVSLLGDGIPSPIFVPTPPPPSVLHDQVVPSLQTSSVYSFLGTVTKEHGEVDASTELLRVRETARFLLAGPRMVLTLSLSLSFSLFFAL